MKYIIKYVQWFIDLKDTAPAEDLVYFFFILEKYALKNGLLLRNTV